MATDPYEVIGVKRDASHSEIQKAYRQQAKKLHPDLNPGDKQAERKFQELSAAWDILGDKDKRARFDRGEIDAAGDERPQQRRYYRDYAGGGDENPYANNSGFSDLGDAGDIFADLFGGRSGGRTSFRMRGADLRFRLAVDFLDAVNGATKQVTLGDGTTIDITIPPGTEDGQVLRLRGKGAPGSGSGSPGDALVEIEVRPHPYFVRDGDNIRLVLPISLREAMLGSKIEVPTPTGRVRASIPENSSSGRVLRLKGKGARRRDGSRGDELVTLQIALPEPPDAELKRFVSSWEAGKLHNPRRAAGLE
ncbi:MAG: putative Heat shock protein-DnaJ-like protein [Hyphomicrobiales bacterium]|nr:putative Heat shock protein-DnaJ-like protein [Hyphomicrobiales bacterium]